MFAMNRQIPPGPDGGFLGLGNTLRYKVDPFGFLTEIAETYGDIVSLQLVGDYIYSKHIKKTTGVRSDYIVLLNHPDFVQQVFVDERQKFKKPDFLRASLRGNWGDALASLEEDAWKKRRRLLQPMFHQRHIAAYAQTIVECTEDMLASWRPDTPINLDQEMLILTARIAVRTVLDAELEGFGSAAANKQRSGVINFAEAMGEDFTTTQDSADSPPVSLSRRRAGPKMDTTRAIIENRLISQENRGDMLSFLLQVSDDEGKRLTSEEVTDEVLQLFFAGHHTIPTTLIWLFYALSQNPEVEAKVFQEVDSVLEVRRPGAEDLPRLPYAELVIKESMRFYSSSLMIVREVAEDVRVGPYILEKGTLIYVSPYLLQRDPRNFEQPERFWPERFSNENTKSVYKYAFLPFGTGPRNCIGFGLAMLQVRLILASIAQSYRLSLLPDQVIVPKVSLTIRPAEDTYMQVAARLEKSIHQR
jgi:cytochrome P450